MFLFLCILNVMETEQKLSFCACVDTHHVHINSYVHIILNKCSKNIGWTLKKILFDSYYVYKNIFKDNVSLLDKECCCEMMTKDRAWLTNRVSIGYSLGRQKIFFFTNVERIGAPNQPYPTNFLIRPWRKSVFTILFHYE